MGFSGGQFTLLALVLGVGLIYALVTMNTLRGTVDNLGLQIQELQDVQVPKGATATQPVETDAETPEEGTGAEDTTVAEFPAEEIPVEANPVVAFPNPEDLASVFPDAIGADFVDADIAPRFTVMSATVTDVDADGTVTFTPPVPVDTPARSSRSRGGRRLGSKQPAAVTA